MIPRKEVWKGMGSKMYGHSTLFGFNSPPQMRYSSTWRCVSISTRCLSASVKRERQLLVLWPEQQLGSNITVFLHWDFFLNLVLLGIYSYSSYTKLICSSYMHFVFREQIPISLFSFVSYLLHSFQMDIPNSICWIHPRPNLLVYPKFPVYSISIFSWFPPAENNCHSYLDSSGLY